MPISFQPFRNLLLLLIFIGQMIPALSLQHPLARHFIDGSATPVDRDLGSGGDLQHVPWAHIDFGDCIFDAEFCLHYTASCRLGEADNPGPQTSHLDLLAVGTSNPGGLRRKETHLLEKGPGIWTMTETHLSQTTMKTTAGILRSGGNNLNRTIRPIFSAPAPLRCGSDWAGSWSGVSTTSDFPSTKLQVPWPTDHWESARVLLTRHWVSGCPIVVGGFYGFAQGPTWPASKQLSNELLSTFTQEVVIGMAGIRIIQGDFNYDPMELDQQRVWHQYGWRSAQAVAAEMFDHEIQATCKKATERDQIWLSPEAIQLLRNVTISDDFADHSTLMVSLAIPGQQSAVATWPRPQPLPWHDISTEDWQPDQVPEIDAAETSTDFFARFSNAFEAECGVQYHTHAGKALPKQTLGRAQRLKPLMQQQATPGSSPSREGEVALLNSMVGSETRLWFKQLRRLQSLSHAVFANKMTPSAIVYRAELWSAILRAKGFCPDFAEWWSNRTPILDGSPPQLPQGGPAVGADAHLLYEEFLGHFRAFEHWHLQQRSTSIRAKYDGSLKALFQDLRTSPRNGVDTLWREQRYAILAIDPATGQIQLDTPVSTAFDFVWLHDTNFVQISNIEADTCTLSPCCNVEVGDELVQRIFVHDVHDLHRLFQDHWSPRWNMLASISDSDWNRIQQFAQVYMPRHQFEAKPLTRSDWRRICSKFKPGAARGPDGYAKEDLQKMPDAYIDSYLQLMSQVECTDREWPDQLQQGLVIGLAKHDMAHEPGHFRPITLFSVWYRAWARFRTKEMIHQMAEHMPPEALGFLPHRETTELWLTLQATIEAMMTMGHTYVGLSTDLQRAFNCIGRTQTFVIAEHLGISDRLLHPWKKFLGSFNRRFEIRGTVGDPMTSSSGFPEGCPLSIVAMLCVNWTFHVYMQVFAPRVCSYSFVDNLTLAALEPALIAQAYFALCTVCQLFGLLTDASKTYVWGTTASARKRLGQLQFAVLQDASELGGTMTYGASIRNRELKKRGYGLAAKWERLKRSPAPLLQKYTILPKVFWPKALHGAMNCLVADTYVQGLRTQATKALKVNGAGANSLLRLTLSDDMCNDPGFYQIFTCLRTFQRMLRKSPDLLPLWRLRMQLFDGKLVPGPFSRLFQCVATLGWAVLEPPWIQDHENRQWDLRYIDGKTLQAILQDAWLQFVASTLQRQTMKALHGLDGHLTLLDTKDIGVLDRHLVSALHSGAFMTSYEQAKFDPEKSAFCVHCECEDDRAHWLQCPRYDHLRGRIPGWHSDNCMLPDCLLHHLLVPRLEISVSWRAALWAIPDAKFSFCLDQPPPVLHHLFLDGSCESFEHAPLQLAAWAVVNASTCQMISMGPLCGLIQTIDRAELSAIVSAVLWAGFHGADACLWSDSLSNVRLANVILANDSIPEGVANLDLWSLFLDASRSCAGLQLLVQWIPSHLHPEVLEDPCEDWLVHWNAVADEFAVRANKVRPLKFWQLWHQYRLSLDWWSTRVRQLRAFYVMVAQTTSEAQAEPDLLPDEPECIELDAEPLEDQLPVNWQSLCEQSHWKYPTSFLPLLVNWIAALELAGGPIRVLSEVEFVFALISDRDFLFPIQAANNQWTLKSLDQLFHKPTLSQLLRPVQAALKKLQHLFSHLALSQPPITDHAIGLYKPFRGVRLAIPDEFHQRVRQQVCLFTQNRPVRRSNDLARPA